MGASAITSPAGLLVFSQLMLGLVALVQLQLGGLLLFFWGQYNTNLSFLGFLWALLPIDLESACILAIPIAIATAFVQYQRSRDVWKQSKTTWHVCCVLQAITVIFLMFYAYKRLDYHYNNKERHGYFHQVCSAHKSGDLLKKIDVCQNVIYEDGALICAFAMIGINFMSTLLVLIAGHNQQVFVRIYKLKTDTISKLNAKSRTLKAMDKREVYQEDIRRKTLAKKQLAKKGQGPASSASASSSELTQDVPG